MIQNNYISPSLLRLAEQFQTLPGIGRKNAMRLAFAILQKNDMEANDFVTAITDARTKIKYCSECMNMCEEDICPICADKERDHSTICVVEDVRAVMAFEKVREFHGVYHVLHGVLSPVDHIGPKDLKITELLARLNGDEVKEVIVATAPTVEGDATAIFLANLLKPLGVSVTRLAFGIPVGGDIEYADEITLSRSLENRREM